jgi:prepilin-type N-terminal cleavage/methylation domain-containing protein
MTDPARQDGFTLVEILIAMVVLTIAITALVAGLSSGIVGVKRAASASSAGAIADQQMEGFRGTTFDNIGTTTGASLDATYTGASAYNASLMVTSTCAQSYCTPTQTVTSSGLQYRVDTYVNWACPAGGTVSTAVSPYTCTGETVQSMALKQVTVIVRDSNNTSKILFTESSNFDPLAG